MPYKELPFREPPVRKEDGFVPASDELRHFNARVFDLIFNTELSLREDRPDVILLDGADTLSAAAGLEWLFGEISHRVGADNLPRLIPLDLGFRLQNELLERREPSEGDAGRYSDGFFVPDHHDLLTALVSENALASLQPAVRALQQHCQTVLAQTGAGNTPRLLRILRVIDADRAEDPRTELLAAFLKGALPESVTPEVREETIFWSHDFWADELGVTQVEAHLARQYDTAAARNAETVAKLATEDELVRQQSLTLTQQQFADVLTELAAT